MADDSSDEVCGCPICVLVLPGDTSPKIYDHLSDQLAVPGPVCCGYCGKDVTREQAQHIVEGPRPVPAPPEEDTSPSPAIDNSPDNSADLGEGDDDPFSEQNDNLAL